MLCRHAQPVTVGQSSTRSRRHGEREGALSEPCALRQRVSGSPSIALSISTRWSEFVFWSKFMFSCALVVPSLIQSYHWICLRPLFLRCVRKSSFWPPLHSNFFSDLNTPGEQHVFCHIHVGCGPSARQWGANQWQCNGKSRCGRSGHWRQDRHLDERAPLLALRTPSSSFACLPATLPAWQSGPTQHLVP